MIKPILFNTEMARAALTNRKTVTRRPVKPVPAGDGSKPEPLATRPGYWNAWGDDNVYRQPCKSGDILYVREAFSFHPDNGPGYIYKSDYQGPYKIRWKPSIHMPRKAARVFLLVTDVGVERLQDITPEQAMKEGVIDPNNRPYIQFEEVGQLERYAMHKMFPEIWSSTIKPKDRALYGWDANPWVWVIEFVRCEKPQGWPK